jgi:hypothetical protein
VSARRIADTSAHPEADHPCGHEEHPNHGTDEEERGEHEQEPDNQGQSQLQADQIRDLASVGLGGWGVSCRGGSVLIGRILDTYAEP